MATTTEPAYDGLADEYIVDVDFHLNVSKDDLIGYVDDDTIRRKLEFGLPQQRGTAGWISSYAHHNVDGRNSHGNARSAGEIADVKEAMGLDVVVVTPGMLGLPTARYDVLKNAVARAYNDYVLDQVIDEDRGIYATLITPQWDVDAAVRELDRHGTRDGFVGAQAWYCPMAPMGALEFDALYDALTELDLPLLLHGSGFAPRYDMHSDAFETRTESMLHWHTNAMTYIVNLIFTGVFEKYPALDVVVQEAGVGWIPFLANHFDETYQTHAEDLQIAPRLYELGREYLSRPPSETLFERFRFSTQPIALPNDARHVGPLFEMCRAEETFMFSSDWPHHTLDVPSWLFEQPGIDEELRSRIAHGNAEDVFDRIAA